MLQPEVHDAVPPGAPVAGQGSARSDVAVVGGGASGTLLWETTAVPEIRGQAAALAQRLPERVRGRLPA